MKKTIKLLCVLMSVLLLFGCGTAPAENTQTAETNTEKSAISFVDDDGVRINLDKPAEKIITLYSAHSENLYYLGAGDKLIGAYKTCTFPPDAAFLPRFDYNGDPEAVIAANPDLVIIRPFVRKKAPDYVAAIEQAGILVVSLYPNKYEDFDDYIKKLASLVGKEEKADELLSVFHDRIDEISAKTADIEPKQTIFFESTETEVRTVTPDSMPGLAIGFAGGINLAADAQPIEEGSSIAAFGDEKVLMHADDIDVYVSQRGAMNSGASKQGISERAGFEVIKALKDGRFYTINEKLISSPSFRYTKGVNELARYLYPDVMDDISAWETDEPATRRDFANILFRQRHIPVFVPSSSSYYENEQTGHTFGLFVDVPWDDADFDAIESAVDAGAIEGRKNGDEEVFEPDAAVTRDELAQTIFVLGDFKANDKNTPVSDIDESAHKRIVQTLVDNGIFELKDGKFEPNRQVTKNEIIKAIECLG